MEYLLKKNETEIKEGIKLKLIPTKKYKDLNIFISFINDFNEKEYASLMTFKDIVGLVSKNYPTKKDMSRKKNLLYAASVEGINTFISYHHCFTFHYNFVDTKYIEKINNEDYIDFIKETLLNPLINEETINENKKILIEAITRKLDKPATFAKNRINQILSKQDKRFGIHDIDIREEISNLTIDDINKVIDKLMNQSLIEIIVIGDIDSNLENGLKSLPFASRSLVLDSYSDIKLESEELISETKKIDQTSLISVYQFNQSKLFEGKRYYTWMIANGILGLLPSSLLFQEVREKLSLCYVISSFDNKSDGLIQIQTLISKENIKEVEKQIDIQIQRLIKGDYPLDQFDTCKKLLIDSFIQGMDDCDSVYNYYHSRSLFKDESFDEFINGLLNVNKEDISELLKEGRHIFTYCLTSDDGKDIQ